jgi:hypothetical protein
MSVIAAESFRYVEPMREWIDTGIAAVAVAISIAAFVRSGRGSFRPHWRLDRLDGGFGLINDTGEAAVLLQVMQRAGEPVRNYEEPSVMREGEQTLLPDTAMGPIDPAHVTVRWRRVGRSRVYAWRNDHLSRWERMRRAW